jgi:hypothetical protein
MQKENKERWTDRNEVEEESNRMMLFQTVKNGTMGFWESRNRGEERNLQSEGCWNLKLQWDRGKDCV